MMKTIKSFFFLTGLFLSSSIMASRLPAHEQTILSYLDPGTGSFIFQMIIAGFVGGLFALKLFWSHVKTFFSRLFSKRKKQDDSK